MSASQHINLSWSKQQLLPRQKQIGSLNDDKLSVPKRKRFSLHLQLFVLFLFQLTAAQFLHDMYSSQHSLNTNSDMDSFEQTESSQTETLSLNTKSKTQESSDLFSYTLISLIYLSCGVASYKLSFIKSHFQNIKHISQLINDYNKMRNQSVKLEFHIQCYHQEQTHQSQRGKQTRKVITHTAKKPIHFTQSYDFSGFLTPHFLQSLKKPYILIDFKPEYQMIQEKQKDILQLMYNNFIAQNIRDLKQDCSRSYGFQYLQLKSVQVYALDTSNHRISFPLLLLSSFFMLIWPLSIMADYFFVEKYDITLIKKVKLDEKQAGYQIFIPNLL